MSAFIWHTWIPLKKFCKRTRRVCVWVGLVHFGRYSQEVNEKSVKLAVWAVSLIFFVWFHIVCERYTSDWAYFTFITQFGDTNITKFFTQFGDQQICHQMHHQMISFLCSLHNFFSSLVAFFFVFAHCIILFFVRCIIFFFVGCIIFLLFDE